MNACASLTFLVFFSCHIPITLLVDLQGLFGEYYPAVLRQLLRWHIQSFDDRLMEETPVWFQSFLWAEFVFQLPLFFAFVWGILYKKNWIRIPGIVYGTHTATTCWPIIGEILWKKSDDEFKRNVLLALDAPFFVFPLLFAAFLIVIDVPFPPKVPKVD